VIVPQCVEWFDSYLGFSYYPAGKIGDEGLGLFRAE